MEGEYSKGENAFLESVRLLSTSVHNFFRSSRTKTNMIKSPGARSSAAQRISRLTLEQEQTLETEFSKGKTLHETDLALLAAEMGANEIDVREWYIQRVATWRRSQGLSDCFGQI